MVATLMMLVALAAPNTQVPVVDWEVADMVGVEFPGWGIIFAKPRGLNHAEFVDLTCADQQTRQSYRADYEAGLYDGVIFRGLPGEVGDSTRLCSSESADSEGSACGGLVACAQLAENACQAVLQGQTEEAELTASGGCAGKCANGRTFRVVCA